MGKKPLAIAMNREGGNKGSGVISFPPVLSARLPNNSLGHVETGCLISSRVSYLQRIFIDQFLGEISAFKIGYVLQDASNLTGLGRRGF